MSLNFTGMNMQQSIDRTPTPAPTWATQMSFVGTGTPAMTYTGVRNETVAKDLSITLTGQSGIQKGSAIFNQGGGGSSETFGTGTSSKYVLPVAAAAIAVLLLLR